MKTMKTLLAAGVIACGLFTAPAQTNTTTSAIDFPSTAAAWLSSIDYTKAWPTNQFDLSTGALWRNNSQWGNYLNVQKNFGNWVTFAEMDNEGLLNKIYRIQGGGGYRVMNRGDLEIQATIGGGYDKINGCGFVEPQLTLKKIMAHGAFTEISLNYDVNFAGKQQDYPGLRVGGGFTF